jgi:hypothetical protein
MEKKETNLPSEQKIVSSFILAFAVIYHLFINTEQSGWLYVIVFGAYIFFNRSFNKDHHLIFLDAFYLVLVIPFILLLKLNTAAFS